ncbi:putative F-box protein At1g65770 [Phoenix dactylifera]|uniref:F-box protein At1g65770 n=1 Tax=Phoenix dactylifera TaxID=42345 RepID=A0A8B8J2M9_PHODC|nr:putative F-box protein At1g65770 [Phoenix dactylifera]
MPNWTDLPLELLNEISDKLPCCVDKVRFRSVCCVWRAAVPQIRFPPVLMLPYNPYTKSISFYSLYENQVVTFPLPEAREKVLCGASKGWLVLMDESGAISLLNPITRAQVQLPPVTEQIALASGFKVSKRAEGNSSNSSMQNKTVY